MENQEPKAPAPETSAPNLNETNNAQNFEFAPAPSFEKAPSGEQTKTSSQTTTNQTTGANTQTLTPGQNNTANSQNQDSDTNIGSPLIADDVDVLEKEWVDKAKKIVDETRHDPREQKRVLALLKADYMKKRYGKEVKIVKD